MLAFAYSITASLFAYVSCHTCLIQNNRGDCSSRGFEIVPQDLPRNLTSLDLKRNLIGAISHGDFQFYGRLVILILDKNKISVLQSNAFRGLKHLKHLSMAENRLDLNTSYVLEIFGPLKSLDRLYISRNMQVGTDLPVYYPFFGYCRKLTILEMDLARKPVWNKCGLSKLKQLRTLSFNFCFLDKMTNGTFAGMPPSIENVYFAGCKVRELAELNFLKPFHSLKILRLFQICMDIESALKIVYPFKKMEELNFTEVNPGYCDGLIRAPNAVIINADMTKYLRKVCLRKLILIRNGIVDFKPNSLLSYNHPECFVTIIFSGDRFSMTNGFKTVELTKLILQLSSLVTFNYSGILSISTDEMNSGLTANTEYAENLDHLIANNRKSDVQIMFPFPRSLEILVLSKFDGVQRTTPHTIYLSNINYLRVLDLSYFKMKYFPNILFNGTNFLEYVDLSGIDSTLYSGRKNIPLFKESKTLILKHARLDLTLRRSKQIFSLVPTVKRLDISYNHLWFLPIDAFNSNKHLRHLDMGFNLFSEVPIALNTLTNLEILNLEHNNLQTINETFQQLFDLRNERIQASFQLKLSGNLFRCNCKNSDFVLWISKTRIKLDKPARNYTCQLENGTYTNTQKAAENFHEFYGNCLNEMWLRVGICLLMIFITFTTPIAVIVNFRWRIAYWVYRVFKRVVENDLRSKLKYDIYLSYSDDCFDWVKNVLIPKIENTWKMTMCIEDRDILAGIIRSDAISKSIHESKNILFIISKSFSEKTWGKFEIERAKYEKYTGHLQRIIVITRNVQVENFPMELDCILDDVFLVDWSDQEIENGWDKLRMALFSDYN
ncbi:TLR8 [Mytilus coruscus]|uniref:TLR8 n=1 Tax=Mytilus coruscus TaxID=42192 RepID=A0A6J8E1X0_MYTCO|nr:TLR8 [Mytilus coruscus]